MDIADLELDDEVRGFIEQQKDFSIDRVSQEGGNCDIFFGYHKIFDRRIALKIYYGSEKSSSHYEPRALSKIDHPNILKVRDAKRIGNYYSYFMTDEISGGDLEKYFQDGKLDLKEKLDVIHGVLNGLTLLHSSSVSIVHRDLKPKNILIYDDTKQPLISDFGSIKQFDQTIGSVSASKTTLVYRPKEAFDTNLYTKQSDIYQIGVTMFQILGGHFPGAYADWLTEAELRKLKAIRGAYEQTVFIDKAIQKLVTKNTLLKLDTLPPYIDRRIVKVIQGATNPKLNLRFQDTGVYLNALFKIQKRLTNWKEDDGGFYATTYIGDEFRVVRDKKGAYTEKLGNGGWRRSGEVTKDLQSHFDRLN